jgi:hypothetical protein
VQRYVTRAIKPMRAALDEPRRAAGAPRGRLEAWELAFALKVRELIGAEFKVETPTPRSRR